MTDSNSSLFTPGSHRPILGQACSLKIEFNFNLDALTCSHRDLWDPDITRFPAFGSLGFVVENHVPALVTGLLGFAKLV